MYVCVYIILDSRHRLLSLPTKGRYENWVKLLHTLLKRVRFVRPSSSSSLLNWIRWAAGANYSLLYHLWLQSEYLMTDRIRVLIFGMEELITITKWQYHSLLPVSDSHSIRRQIHPWAFYTSEANIWIGQTLRRKSRATCTCQFCTPQLLKYVRSVQVSMTT